MKKLLPAFLAVAFAATSTATMLVGQAQTASANGSTGLFAGTASVALADGDDNDKGDRKGRKHGKRDSNGGSYGGNNGGSSISGCVVSGVFNGNEVTLQTTNNGQVTVNEQHLINSGRGLSQGQCVTLRGYYNGNVFNVSNGSGGGYRNGGNRGENDNEQGDQGNRGNKHGCMNPAGHERGWCKHHRNDGYNGGNNGNGGGYNNGSCRQNISGYIILVSGNNVTVNQNLIGGTRLFDASRAINNRQTNGNLRIGRHITACGYSDGSGFHATFIR
ncbi:MAG: hypothetical protein M3Y18_00500 [Candidatus Eremiobacteraeota bacterium]|nr:hypothetical protein [Candidatus Eremiobacteraeota bacterium]